MSYTSSEFEYDASDESEESDESELVEQEPAAIMDMHEAARQLRKLCDSEQAPIASLTESEVFDMSLGQLAGKIEKRNHPSALVISSSILQRTVTRLALSRAGFQVSEGVDIRDGISKVRTADLDTIIVDINSTGLDRSGLLHVAKNTCKRFLPVIAMLSPLISTTAHNSSNPDEITPQQAMIEGFDMFIRRPVDKVLGVLCSLFMTSNLRATELMHLASSNYNRIYTVLAEVSDRALYYRVKDASKTYRGVVQGSVETSPAYLKVKNELRDLRKEITELRKDERGTSELLVKKQSMIDILEHENGSLQDSLDVETRKGEVLRKNTITALSRHFSGSDKETSLSLRLNYDYDMSRMKNRVDALAAKLQAECAKSADLTEQCEQMRETLDETTAELMYAKHKEDAKRSESFVLRSAVATRNRDSTTVFNAQTKHAENVSNLGEQVRILENRLQRSQEHAYRVGSICSKLESRLMQLEDRYEAPKEKPKGGIVSGMGAAALPLLFNKKLKASVKKSRAAMVNKQVKRTIGCQTVSSTRFALHHAGRSDPENCTPLELGLDQGAQLVRMKEQECDELIDDLNKDMETVSQSLLGEKYSSSEMKMISTIASRCIKNFRGKCQAMISTLPTAVNGLLVPVKARPVISTPAACLTPPQDSLRSPLSGFGETVERKPSVNFRELEVNEEKCPAPSAAPLQSVIASREDSAAQGLRPSPPALVLPSVSVSVDTPVAEELHPVLADTSDKPQLAMSMLSNLLSDDTIEIANPDVRTAEAVVALHKEVMKLLLQCKLRSKMTNIKLPEPAMYGRRPGFEIVPKKLTMQEYLRIMEVDCRSVGEFTRFYEQETDTLRARMRELLRKNVEGQVRSVKSCQTGFLFDNPLMAPSAEIFVHVEDDTGDKQKAANTTNAMKSGTPHRTVTTFGSSQENKAEYSYFPRRPVSNREFVLDKARLQQKKSRTQYLQTSAPVPAVPYDGTGSALAHMPVAPLLPPV